MNMSYLKGMLKPNAVAERKRFLREVNFPEGEIENFLKQSLKEQMEFIEDIVEKIYAAGGRTDAIRHMWAKDYSPKHSSLGFIDNND